MLIQNKGVIADKLYLISLKICFKITYVTHKIGHPQYSKQKI